MSVPNTKAPVPVSLNGKRGPTPTVNVSAGYPQIPIAQDTAKGQFGFGPRRSSVMEESPRLREQRTQIVGMLLVIVLMVILLQLWLVTIAIDESLAGRAALALPSFCASACCFGVNLWLLKLVFDLDVNHDSSKRPKREGRS